MPRPIAALREDQSGFALVMVAMMLTVLIAMAAFAVDFGWLYWNGIKIQHGADAAALSGVVYEPNDQATAYSEARAAASENGYLDTDPGTTVTPVDFADDPTAVHNANQLSVKVTDTVPTFFMKIFGVDTVAISKHAIAEYVLPLAMGSDLPYFGNDPALGRTPNLWANIHGYYTGRSMGDRYASHCLSGTSGYGCTENPEVRDSLSPGTVDATGGYVYGIEVPAGANGVSVDIFGGPFYRDGGDYFLTGDNPQGSSEAAQDEGPTTYFQLYSPDPTPLDTTDGNVLLCSISFGAEDNFADFDGDGNLGSWDGTNLKWKADPDDDRNGDGWFDWSDVIAEPSVDINSLWTKMCGTSFNNGPGIYPLRVLVEDPGNTPGHDYRGLNRYSLRAWTTSGPDPRIYGLGDMSIYVNAASNTAHFDFAEVPEVHRGKTLVIELWDSDSGITNVAIKQPGGGTQSCDWSATNPSNPGGTDGDCSIPTGSLNMNDQQMEIRLAIDNGYTCAGGGSDCWWTIDLIYNNGANDTTTWAAHIEGNPVRLVE